MIIATFIPSEMIKKSTPLWKLQCFILFSILRAQSEAPHLTVFSKWLLRMHKRSCHSFISLLGQVFLWELGQSGQKIQRIFLPRIFSSLKRETTKQISQRRSRNIIGKLILQQKLKQCKGIDSEKRWISIIYKIILQNNLNYESIRAKYIIM